MITFQSLIVGESDVRNGSNFCQMLLFNQLYVGHGSNFVLKGINVIFFCFVDSMYGKVLYEK